MFSIFFENPIRDIVYGIRKLGIRLSSGIHLYNFLLLSLPYTLFPFNTNMPGIYADSRTIECNIVVLLFSFILKISFVNNFSLTGSMFSLVTTSNCGILYTDHSLYSRSFIKILYSILDTILYQIHIIVFLYQFYHQPT